MQFTTMISINNNYKSTILSLMILCALLMAHVQSASINNTSTDLTEDRSFKSAPVEAGRTFGAIKRFQTALLPIMYKLGFMSAVIFMTLFLAFKSVFLTTLILILNFTFFAIKFGSYLKHDHGHYVGHSAWSAPPAPPIHHGWPAHKDVHLHIHNLQPKPEFSIPYSTLGGSIGGGGGGGSNHLGGWAESQSYSSVIEPAWATSNSYIQKGRSFGDGDDGGNDNDLMPYASTRPINADKFGVSNIIVKRSDQREPTIIMAQNKHEVTPYNYLSKQNRN